MQNKTITDISYDLIESIERRKKWFTYIVIGCVALAPAGLLLNVMAFMQLSHQKYGLFDLNTIIIISNIIICSLFVVIGVNQYIFLKKWTSQIKQLEVLEEKIYQEVLRPK